jgi:protoheme IX farnesyltransferase
MQAGLLFAILFLWQFPHFLAIALMYKEDYGRAGFHMLPAFDVEGRFTRAEIIVFTLVLIATTLLPGLAMAHNFVFLAGMIVAGAFFLYYCLKLAQSNTRSSASHLLHASVVYLPVVLAVMMVFKP